MLLLRSVIPSYNFQAMFVWFLIPEWLTPTHQAVVVLLFLLGLKPVNGALYFRASSSQKIAMWTRNGSGFSFWPRGSRFLLVSRNNSWVK